MCVCVCVCVMGLKPSSGPTPKAFLRENFRPPFARTRRSRTRATTWAARAPARSPRMDGAVACMAVPQGCAGFEMYANCVYLSVRDALSSGIAVVLTLDFQPEAVSNAKKLEQVRRDACSKKRKIVTCSNDLAPPSPPLDYDRAELRAQPSMHDSSASIGPLAPRSSTRSRSHVLERAPK